MLVNAATRPGGRVWALLPTVSGLTPIGLACLFAGAGSEIFDLARGSLRAHGYGHVLRAARRLSIASFLADGTARDDVGLPAQTWVLARRPA